MELSLLPLTKEYDRPLADLIRKCLKDNGLDLPGTVYFDEGLDHLSDFYSAEPDKRRYFVAADDSGCFLGGIGFAEFKTFPACAEMQKLYLNEAARGQGLSYELIARAEEAARELGYSTMYLETHTNLRTAIHLYEKAGYRRIERPKSVVHSTMNTFMMKEL